MFLLCLLSGCSFFEDYSPNITEESGLNTLSDVDNNVYPLVTIGSQTWMAENLRTTHYRDGTPIPTYMNNATWMSDTAGAFAWYENNPLNRELYGALYNWYAASHPRGLCPAGWRVSTDEDWMELVRYVASAGYPNDDFTSGAGNALKSCRQILSPHPECTTHEHPRWEFDPTNLAFNAFGFAGLPGGFRNVNGLYGEQGMRAYWWNTTDINGSAAWYRSLEGDTGFVCCYTENKKFGFSIRCIKE